MLTPNEIEAMQDGEVVTLCGREFQALRGQEDHNWQQFLQPLDEQFCRDATVWYLSKLIGRRCWLPVTRGDRKLHTVDGVKYLPPELALDKDCDVIITVKCGLSEWDGVTLNSRNAQRVELRGCGDALEAVIIHTTDGRTVEIEVLP